MRGSARSSRWTMRPGRLSVKCSLQGPLTGLLGFLLLSSSVHADPVILRLREWEVTAPGGIGCSEIPRLTVKGSEALFNDANRAACSLLLLESRMWFAVNVLN